MTKDELINITLLHPSVRAIVGSTNAQKRVALEAMADLAVDKAAGEYTYDFLMSSSSTVTVANQSDYTLLGDKAPARDIIWVTYGTNGLFLFERSELDVKRLISGSTGTLSTTVWHKLPKTEGQPRIRLIGTPSSAGKAINYGYRIRGVTIDLWPSDFAFVVVSHLVAMLVPAFLPVAVRDAAAMAANYDKGPAPRGAVPQDQGIVNANIARNRRFGYGGRRNYVIVSDE